MAENITDLFVATDSDGNFTLDGKPYFLHGATYFARRPGTCGADWMGENFAHNAGFFEQDFATMRELGINTLGLFVPARTFFDGMSPVQERFDQLKQVLDAMRPYGLRAIVYANRALSREAWCAENGVDPDAGYWHAAVNPHAERYAIDSHAAFRRRFADRAEIIGWATKVGRFFRYGFDVPGVREAWTRWLRDRFGEDLERLRGLFGLSGDEQTWEDVRMPTEMEPYFNEDNPRSFEFALMQQVLCARASASLCRALRPVTPNQLLVEPMEGCCFSSGHLTDVIPERVAADALWLECYHWEGLRSYHFGDGPPRWMKEPIAAKPSAHVVSHAGYVQMLVRWARQSGKPIIICHGVDIGEEKRGARNEDDQRLLIDRFNRLTVASGAHGSNYWCWNDDELSKTYTRQFGVEYTVDTPQDEKAYWQAGETMGVVRYDGSQRPVCRHIRELSSRMRGEPAAPSPRDVLVLFPCPVFQSLYRYRANATGFGILTSLARVGVRAEVKMTSAGEDVITVDDLRPYRLIVMGANEYVRDHPGVPGELLEYVEAGGTLFFALGEAAWLQDEYLRWHACKALGALSGASLVERADCNRLAQIRSEPGAAALPAEWELRTDEPAFLTRVDAPDGAEVLANADGAALLYRRALGRGMVYAFTWNLDVFLFKGGTADYGGPDWDGLWTEVLAALAIPRDPDSEIARVVAETQADNAS
jgi:hypothetical protein